MTGPRRDGKLKLDNTKMSTTKMSTSKTSTSKMSTAKTSKAASVKSELSKIRSHSGKPAPKRVRTEYLDETDAGRNTSAPSGPDRSQGKPPGRSESGRRGRPERSDRDRSDRDRPATDRSDRAPSNRATSDAAPSAQSKAGRDRPKRPADPSRSDISKSGNSKPAPSFDQGDQGAHEARPRLFYALHLPTPVADALAVAQKELRGNWRAVQPDQLHITLAYLPSTDPARLSDFRALGEQLSLETAPITIRLRGTGYHPNEGSPRVWFVRVESVGVESMGVKSNALEGDGLSTLAERLRFAIAELGAETDNQAFKAHITLARKKGPAPRVPPITFETVWEAPTLTLYRSHLQKTGPVYENLASFRFRGTIMSSTESVPIISTN